MYVDVSKYRAFGACYNGQRCLIQLLCSYTVSSVRHTRTRVNDLLFDQTTVELNQQQRHAALSDLATTPTKYWLRKQPGGNRRLHDLHTKCCSVNLVQPSCGPVRNDGDRLLQLFQVALQHGLACIIASFVQDVCLAQQVCP